MDEQYTRMVELAEEVLNLLREWVDRLDRPFASAIARLVSNLTILKRSVHILYWRERIPWAGRLSHWIFLRIPRKLLWRLPWPRCDR